MYLWGALAREGRRKSKFKRLYFCAVWNNYNWWEIMTWYKWHISQQHSGSLTGQTWPGYWDQSHQDPGDRVNIVNTIERGCQHLRRTIKRSVYIVKINYHCSIWYPSVHSNSCLQFQILQCWQHNSIKHASNEPEMDRYQYRVKTSSWRL